MSEESDIYEGIGAPAMTSAQTERREQLLADINKAAHSAGVGAWVRDVLQRAHRAVQAIPAQSSFDTTAHPIKQIDMGYISRNEGATTEFFEPDDEALIFLNDDNEQTCHVEGPNAKAMAQQIVDAVRALAVTRADRQGGGA